MVSGSEDFTVPIIVSKLCSALTIGIVALGGYTIPNAISAPTKHFHGTSRYDKVMCLLNCFGAGSIMGMTFFHMIPETIHLSEHSGMYIQLNDSIFNLCYPLILCGASLVLLAEHVIATRDCHPCPDVLHGSLKLDVSTATNNTIDQTDMVDSSKCISITCPGHGLTSLPNTYEIEHLEPVTSDQYSIRINLLERIRNLCKCKGFFLAIALAFHSIFEGIALGSSDTHAHIWLLFLGIASHKWAAAMALSSSLCSGNNKRSTIITLAAIFCSATPIGTFIGMAVSKIGTIYSAVMNSLAAGTLIYIGAEIISHEFSATNMGKRFPLYQWLTTIAGSILMLFLVIIDLLYIPHKH